MCEAGAIVEIKDQMEQTVLHLAIEMRLLITAEYLIKEAKANINTSGNVNHTPLHLVALNGHSEMVKTLCRAGALVDKRDKLGQTVLHLAIEKGLSTAR